MLGSGFCDSKERSTLTTQVCQRSLFSSSRRRAGLQRPQEQGLARPPAMHHSWLLSLGLFTLSTGPTAAEAWAHTSAIPAPQLGTTNQIIDTNDGTAYQDLSHAICKCTQSMCGNWVTYANEGFSFSPAFFLPSLPHLGPLQHCCCRLVPAAVLGFQCPLCGSALHGAVFHCSRPRTSHSRILTLLSVPAALRCSGWGQQAGMRTMRSPGGPDPGRIPGEHRPQLSLGLGCVRDPLLCLLGAPSADSPGHWGPSHDDVEGGAGQGPSLLRVNLSGGTATSARPASA